MKIVLAGGGTAGHTFPLLAVAREMRKIYKGQGLEIFYFGPNDNYAVALMEREGIKVKKIVAGKIKRYPALSNLLEFGKMPIGFWQAFWKLFFLAPDLVFSKGGYGSFPVALGAKMLQIPIFLHESDAIPGLASKIESKWAKEIFTSFPETAYFPKEKKICVGNPVRTEILNGNPKDSQRLFQLKGENPLIFIIGGSQGAGAINNLILEILPEMLNEFEIVHQTGKANFTQVRKEAGILIDKAQKQNYHPLPFLNEQELRAVFAACQLIISRGGSGVLFEIAAVGKPALLIPLPGSAQNHQMENVYQFAKHGGGEVLEQENLTPHFFLEKIKSLVQRTKMLEGMGRLSQLFAKPKSANIIANYLLEYIIQSQR